MSRHGVYFFDAVYLIIPKHDTQYVIGICQKDVYRITLYAEIPTVQLNVVTHIKTIHQPAEEHVAVDALSFFSPRLHYYKSPQDFPYRKCTIQMK